jgi:hypothetical protein
MADREMVLRFLAFRLTPPEQYARGDLDAFQRQAMRMINDLPAKEIEWLSNEFAEAMRAGHEIFGKHAFRKRFRGQEQRSPVNKALFESVSGNLAMLARPMGLTNLFSGQKWLWMAASNGRPRHPVSATRRPTNVGFGLTYVLPIITACLTAKPGSMVLLENPEAHVHPQGQSAMARLTCAAAAAGAQLVVETHSDHILNGVRLAVKRGLLPPDGVALHYFRREDDGIKIQSPAIGQDGMLSQWPLPSAAGNLA